MYVCIYIYIYIYVYIYIYIYIYIYHAKVGPHAARLLAVVLRGFKDAVFPFLRVILMFSGKLMV